MSHTHIPISLETNIRKLDNDCLAFGAKVQRYRSNVTATPKSFGTGIIGLTTKEVRALHKSLLGKFVLPETVVAELSKDDVLALPRELVGHDGVVQSRLVVLTIYEGDAPPPANLKDLRYSSAFTKSSTDNGATPAALDLKEWAKFKRFSLPSGTQPSNPSHQRWMRIHGTECAEDEVQHENTNNIFNTEGVQFYLIPMQIRCTRVTVSQALDLCSNMNGNDPAVGVTLSMFLELGGTVDNTPEEPQESRDFAGVTATNEPISHVHLAHNNNLLLSKTTKISVYLKADHKALSDVVAEHCHSSIHRLQSSEGIEILTAKFKGVQVRKRTSSGYEYRTIRAFKLGTVTDVLPQERHSAWPTGDGLILSPSFPLVDVGTARAPLYLPMEVCHVLDKQRMHGPRDYGLTNWVNAMTHANSSGRLSTFCEDVKSSLVFHQYPTNHDLGDNLLRVCDNKSLNLLFVQAGSTVVNGDGWSQLRSELKNSFKTATSSIDSMPLLTLRYASGVDPITEWTQRLQDFVAACDKAEQKPIIIVWLEPEHDHRAMYKIIKRACEVTVGVQTFFVKRETYVAQMYLQPDLKRSATDIRRRICRKNPRMLKITQAVIPKLTIAMHISLVATASQRARPAGYPQASSSIYLVTLVSRDPTGSRYYHTEQGLFNESQLRSCDHVKLLQPFRDLLPNLTLRNSVVLRSGTMLLPKTNASASSGAFDLTNSETFNRSDTSSFDVAEDDSCSSTLARRFDPNSEIEAIRDVFGAARTTRVHYVVLTEDKVLATSLHAPTYHAARPGDKAPAILFIQDRVLVNAADCSVKVQQVPRNSSEDSEKNVYIQSRSITATFHYSLQAAGQGLREITPVAANTLTTPGRDGSRKVSSIATQPRITSQNGSLAHRPHRQSQLRKSDPAPLLSLFSTSAPSTPKPQTPVKMSEVSPSPFLDVQPNDENRQPSTPPMIQPSTPSMVEPTQTVRSKKEALEATISKTDIDYLVGVWKDDELGLYSTQWPVPTHLAHLATERAMTHLRTDDWENTTTAPFSLTKVHDKVRDSLYYL